jgi:hypothetical protein
MVTMDGWKKRAAGRGVPLVNVMLLKPTGGSIFWKVCESFTQITVPNLCAILRASYWQLSAGCGC